MTQSPVRAGSYFNQNQLLLAGLSKLQQVVNASQGLGSRNDSCAAVSALSKPAAAKLDRHRLYCDQAHANSPGPSNASSQCYGQGHHSHLHTCSSRDGCTGSIGKTDAGDLSCCIGLLCTKKAPSHDDSIVVVSTQKSSKKAEQMDVVKDFRRLACNMGHMQVWLGRHIQPDLANPAWQELLSSHRNSSASNSDHDELSGPRVVRSRQRTTLTAIIELPPGDFPSPFSSPADPCCSTRHATFMLHACIMLPFTPCIHLLT